MTYVRKELLASVYYLGSVIRVFWVVLLLCFGGGRFVCVFEFCSFCVVLCFVCSLCHLCHLLFVCVVVC